MIEESEKVKSLRNKIASLEDDYFKIEYLQSLIKDKEQVDLEVLAFIHETLGKLNIGLGVAKPSFFEKAASDWEILAITYDLSKDNSRNYRRKAFLKALDNYLEALSIYKERALSFQAEQVKEKIAVVRSRLRSQNNFSIKIIVFLMMGVFLLSFLFLSSSPTGFVISSLKTEGTTIFGGLLASLAIFGSFILFKLWR